MRDPTSMAPLPQAQNTGLPEDVLFQPNVIGGSHALPAGKRDDFWEQLGDEAQSESTVNNGSNLRQRLNDFPVQAGLVSKQVLQYNAKRTYFAIQNRGASSVFIAFGRPASLESFELPPGPGLYEPILGTVSSVHVIAAVDDVPLIVIEGFRQT